MRKEEGEKPRKETEAASVEGANFEKTRGGGPQIRCFHQNYFGRKGMKYAGKGCQSKELSLTRKAIGPK